jgi:hypothetical protein
MSLFKLVKYSSVIFFLGKYKSKLFRVIAVLLFAGITSVLYGDVAEYLQRAHPGSVIYALVAKIIIVYGALAFVLWQFRPEADSQKHTDEPQPALSARQAKTAAGANENSGPLDALEDVSQKDQLRSRYDRVLEGKPEPEKKAP